MRSSSADKACLGLGGALQHLARDHHGQTILVWEEFPGGAQIFTDGRLRVPRSAPDGAADSDIFFVLIL